MKASPLYAKLATGGKLSGRGFEYFHDLLDNVINYIRYTIYMEKRIG